MSTLPQTVAALARSGGQLLRIPTAVMLAWAGTVVVVLALELWALLAGDGGPGALGSTILLVLLALLALPVVLLWVRRRRWLRLSAEAGTPASGPVVLPTSATSDMVVLDSLSDTIEDEIDGMEGADDVRAVMDAFTEIQLPEASRRGAGARLTRLLGVGRLAVIGRVFGRMERAQRAVLKAAGGPVHAPYLVDDLRITVAAFVGTLLTISVGSLGILVLAAVLLTR